mmetsp:Transcript_13750/g.21476  ORF Transcript_13750/g.21476 Transcript_13750/m.21476 type:complete len:113 (+) Transcript_13750:45-383(+)|eukprot:CAMPEP_0184292190 /NCGR_PEP_ID=MMETSP1049-20130417/4023_1 /TAXON_ID=77928 /ORGANISM="Proteomonas sulcata, Strain CCMP704" /LENGTH=112 /DNA_ID=CAMNT_0026599879 /DNA_START=10 /DNA_END=348 /DNA_ORIENTATION=-
MAGYQSVEDGVVDQGEHETRESHFSDLSLKDQAIASLKVAATEYPRAACVVATIVIILGVHWFFSLLPVLMFWFVLVPGCLVVGLYFLQQYVPLPTFITDRMPAAMGGTGSS